MHLFKTDVCKKDILILLDTSSSIGSGRYDADVVPFLKSLINSPKLNVGPDGTRLALVTFNDEDNTKLRFSFGANTTQKYLDYVDNDLIWSKVVGYRTLTGTAMKIADQTVGL